jgi:hypothetical protein
MAKLVSLQLCDEPGEDVLKFSHKVLDLAKHIECCGVSLCSNLDSIVAQCYMTSICESFRIEVIGYYNKAQKGKGVGFKKMVLDLKNHYNASLGYGMWPAAAKSKAEAASQKDEVILKAMTAVAGSLNALQQKVDGMSGRVGSSTGIAPGTPTTNKPKGPRRTPPGPGEPTTKMVDGILNEWCSKCTYWTSGTKQHNGDSHISCPRSERSLTQHRAHPPAQHQLLPNQTLQLSNLEVIQKLEPLMPRLPADSLVAIAFK